MSFFKSILPSIKNLTEDQKLEFCSEVLSIIKRLKTALPHNYGHQPNFQYSAPGYNWVQHLSYITTRRKLHLTNAPHIHHHTHHQIFTFLIISLNFNHVLLDILNFALLLLLYLNHIILGSILIPYLRTLSSSAGNNRIVSEDNTLDILDTE